MLTASCWCDGLDLFIAVRKMATKPAGEKCWWAITIYNQTIISFPFCCCERHLRSYTALKHQYDTYILKRFPATPNLFTAWSGVSVTSAQPYVQITQTLFDFLEMGKKKKNRICYNKTEDKLDLLAQIQRTGFGCHMLEPWIVAVATNGVLFIFFFLHPGNRGRHERSGHDSVFCLRSKHR